MIVDFIDTLAFKILILLVSMKYLPLKNDCELYEYIGF